VAVAVGDLNGDGALDLAVGTGSGVAVLLGQGDGSFQEARTFGVGNAANSVVVGDLNGDGALDLAVGTRSGVAVLLGQGDGIFQAPLSSGCCGGTLLVGVSDFNGDGKPDLAAAPDSVLLGQGDGTFESPLAFGTEGLNPRSAAVGDFNGDGLPDLAVTNWGKADSATPPLSGSVSVLINNTPRPPCRGHGRGRGCPGHP